MRRRKSPSRMHISRAFGRVGGGERADGIEAVEQEMRIHLGLEGAQLRFAGEHAGLHHAGFGFARGFDRQQDVVKSDREQIQQDARDEKERIVLRELPINPVKFVEAGEHSAQNPRRDEPQRAGHHGARHWVKRIAKARIARAASPCMDTTRRGRRTRTEGTRQKRRSWPQSSSIRPGTASR